MKNKVIQAKGYRVQRIIVKDFIKSVLTLGFKRPKLEPEEAKTYVFQFAQNSLTISEEMRNEQVKEIKTLPLESSKERQSILSKGKFTDEKHVYYVDKETIKDV